MPTYTNALYTTGWPESHYTTHEEWVYYLSCFKLPPFRGSYWYEHHSVIEDHWCDTTQ